ncbi:PEP-CTERM sorting domain-containing protein [Crocosphaera sp.]|uniref:PEP-CTERM sorting domain-containing protein n=1 Tax=Crocosphaera sp. TaxID=2729996 RepID=UPI00260FB7D2|nr:PEP-CTERM sorting domain-containing protein [Crocosphaera sp.]MDJ0579176.1 PEP-CTERM sorting domain-containing protein [Crocosphaera sp.]
MNNFAKFTTASIFALGLSTINVSNVHAATITYDISGSIETGEPSLIGTNYTGQVTFDDLTEEVTSVTFNILGSTFDETDADITPAVVFDGDIFLGLEYTVTVVDAAFELASFTLSTGFDPLDALFDYIPRTGDAGDGLVTYTLVDTSDTFNTSVPEPSSVISLIALGLSGVAFSLKKRSS